MLWKRKVHHRRTCTNSGMLLSRLQRRHRNLFLSHGTAIVSVPSTNISELFGHVLKDVLAIRKIQPTGPQREECRSMSVAIWTIFGKRIIDDCALRWIQENSCNVYKKSQKVVGRHHSRPIPIVHSRFTNSGPKISSPIPSAN